MNPFLWIRWLRCKILDEHEMGSYYDEPRQCRWCGKIDVIPL